MFFRFLAFLGWLIGFHFQVTDPGWNWAFSLAVILALIFAIPKAFGLSPLGGGAILHPNSFCIQLGTIWTLQSRSLSTGGRGLEKGSRGLVGSTRT